MNEIQEKANYCLNCPVKPCSNKGCPLENNIPGFIKAIKEEDYKKAYEILSETTVLEAVCGRICPHTKQCEGSCVRGIKSPCKYRRNGSIYRRYSNKEKL